MTIPTLPTGARLALIKWPGGHPTAQAIIDAAEVNSGDRRADYLAVIQPLFDHALIERLPNRVDGYTVCRLTQPGRKALDVLQSGVD